MEDLRNKVVVITGASTGIGAAVALKFSEYGAKVVINYNKSKDKAENIVKNITNNNKEAIAVQGDVCIEENMVNIAKEAIKSFGEINIFINNAGGMVERASVDKISPETFQKVFDLNCLSVMLGTKIALNTFKEQNKGGCIINTTSIAARLGGSLGAVFYSASKGWVSTFTRGMARELLPHKIRVNGVAPGIIDTPFHEQSTPPEIMEGMIKTIPMGRWASSDEVAGTYLYLASEEMSSYITGQIIEVNGGQLMP